MLEKLLRKTNMIMYKIAILEEKIAKKKDDDEVSCSPSILSQSFPFTAIEEFKKFEQSLMDDYVYKNLVRAF